LKAIIMQTTRLFIAGGDDTLRTSLVRRLAAAGFTVVEHASDAKAAASAAIFKPDILIFPVTDTQQAIALQVRLKRDVANDGLFTLALVNGGVSRDDQDILISEFNDLLLEPTPIVQLRDRIYRIIRLSRMQRESTRRWRTAQRFMQWNEQQPLSLSLIADQEDDATIIPRVAVWACDHLDDARLNSVVEQLRQVAVLRICADEESMLRTVLEGDAEICVLATGANPMRAISFAGAARNSATLFNLPILINATNPEAIEIDRAFSSGASDVLLGDPTAEEWRAAMIGLMRLEQLRRSLANSFDTAIETQIRDSVTGLYTYGFTMDYIDQLIEEARQTGRSFSIGVCRLNNLHQINAHFGYTGGDFTIKRIGQLIERALRVEDLVGRMSGSAFMMVLPDTELSRARIAMGRLSNILRYTTLELPRQNEILTVEFHQSTVEWSGQASAQEMVDDLTPAVAAAA
jgi:diguanylate cyclase (GGDEF)-like protein